MNLDKDIEAKAKHDEMNVDKIWTEYISRILPDAFQAYALAKSADSDEVTPRNRHAYARYIATLDALKSSANALYWTMVPWRNQNGTETIDALIEIAERIFAEHGGMGLDISQACERACAEYFERRA